MIFFCSSGFKKGHHFFEKGHIWPAGHRLATPVIEELYLDTDNKFNRHKQAQWLSEKTVSSYCTYLKTVTNAKVFSFSSYFSSIFDKIGDVSTDNADSLEDPAIPIACHSFIMQALSVSRSLSLFQYAIYSIMR